MLIEVELLLILEALLRTSVRNPAPSTTSPNLLTPGLETPEQTNARIVESSLARLFDVLNPEHLIEELRHGVLDSNSLFSHLGETIKQHCAPARDYMVDDMVQTAFTGQIGLGLKLIFECAEAMKVVSPYNTANWGVSPALDQRHIADTGCRILSIIIYRYIVQQSAGLARTFRDMLCTPYSEIHSSNNLPLVLGSGVPRCVSSLLRPRVIDVISWADVNVTPPPNS